MLTAVLWCFVTGFLFTGVSVYFSHINRHRIDYVQFSLCSAIFLFLICLSTVKWHGLFQANHIPNHLLLLLLVMTVAGVAIAGGMLMMIAAMKSGCPDVVWPICQSSMIIPFVMSILLNGQSVSIWNIMGIIVIIFGITLFGIKKASPVGGQKKGWFALTLMSFFVIGIGQYCFSIPSFWSNWGDSYSLRIPIQSTGGLLLLITLIRPGKLLKMNRKLWLHGFSFAILTYAGRRALYNSIDALALIDMASIAYPVCLGMSILGFFIYHVLCQKKVNKESIIGVTLLVCGLLLIGYK